MAYNFDNDGDIGGTGLEALPVGTLAWARIEEVEITTSKTSGNAMADYVFELIGKHAGRKLFYEYMVYGGVNKNGNKNSQQADARLKAMLLTSKKSMNGFANIEEAIQATLGCVVGVRLKQKPPHKKTGKVYNELWNEVSPDANSKTHKDYIKLVAEQGEPPLASVPQVASSSAIDDEIPF